jgi:NADH-quinone oxidoreductase subunit D
VRCLIDDIPEGPICGLKPVKLPGAVKSPETATIYSAIESPRGELGTWVVGTKRSPNPYRCKIRPPSMHSLALLPYMCPGNNLSDIIVILGSLDPIMGEVDR